MHQRQSTRIIYFQLQLNIEPDKGWKTESMFVPAGVHIDAEYKGEGKKEEKDHGEQPFAYPMGIGGVLMNGCYSRNYQRGDPCYNIKSASTICFVS